MRVGEMPSWLMRCLATICHSLSGLGIIGGAVVDNGRCPQQRRAKNEPGAHHPAHVGHPVNDVAGMHVCAKGHVLRGFDGEAAVRVDCAFGFAGGAAGVDEHERIFGGGGFRFCLVGLGGDEVVPPLVAPGLHGGVVARAAQHDDVFDCGQVGEGFVGGGFEGHDFAAPEETIGGEEGFGVGVGQSGLDGACAVAGEEGQDDAADFGNR